MSTRAWWLGRCSNQRSGRAAQIDLIHHDYTPIVPLRGSISASGDLTPLSYVAGAIMGCPDIQVDMGKKQKHAVMAAD